ncbi:hypothetical protein H0H92_005855 [Tricholoma furcatifolium]|nr:hypothetical protein H0H92_005855 [Tricholoma furcatifolium]
MPPRLNKRQQRELEELSALAGPATPEQDPESSDEQPISQSQHVGFSSRFLASEEPENEEDEEEDDLPVAATKSRKKKKGKKKAAEAPPPPPQKNEKKAAKRAKAQAKKAGDVELEEALAELGIPPPAASSPAPSTAGPSTTVYHPFSKTTLSSLLAVSLSDLDPTVEMRKFFGSKVVRSSASSTSGTGSATGNRRLAAAALKNKMMNKSHLTRPQPTWWSANQREGLTIRALDAGEVEEKMDKHGWDTASEAGKDRDREQEKWYTVEYSQRYKSMTKLFIQAVMSGHPDALWEVQRKLPWHADNLLQLAEVSRHREEHAQAVDYTDRALFTYERAFVGAFNFTTGLCRLDFDRVENRPFFLAIHRQVADLTRRGCIRTAFEFARLLWALDPLADPHGALFHIDSLALRGGMHTWLIDAWNHFDKIEPRRSVINPSLLPGWAYARALAIRMVEGDSASHEESTRALEEAMRAYPEVVPLLADKLDVTLPGHIRAHTAFQVMSDAGFSPTEGALHALAHLYATHSSSPWKDPSNSAWFVSTATSAFPSPLPSSHPSASPSFPAAKKRRAALLEFILNEPEALRSITRHILVLESTHRRILSFLPKDILQSGGGAGLACDPVPPGVGVRVSAYDAAYFAGVEDTFSYNRPGRGGADDQRLLEHVIPDAGVRARVMEVLDALRGQFPGGLREMVERLGPEAVDDMLGQMVGVAVGEEGAGPPQGMPGGLFFPDVGEELAHEPEPEQLPAVQEPVIQQEVEEAEEEDESEEDEQDEPLVRRFLRGVMTRMFGGPVGGSDSSDEEEEEEETGVGPGHDDNDGVD